MATWLPLLLAAAFIASVRLTETLWLRPAYKRRHPQEGPPWWWE
jgi:hypothetical protein